MNQEKLNSFFRSFCLDDGLRTSMKKPNYYDNGYIAATNSHVLAFSHQPDFDKTDCIDSGIEIWPVVSPYSNCYERGHEIPIGIIKVSDLDAVFAEIKKLPEYEDKYKDCSDCDGNGTVECDCCGHESDCETCDGDGEVVCGKEETGYYRFPDNEVFIINGEKIGLETTNKISESLKLIDAKELEIFPQIKPHQLLYRVKDTNIYILQMGVAHSNRDIKNKHIIKINN